MSFELPDLNSLLRSPSSERRLETRYAASEAVEIEVVESASSARCVHGRVLNVSRSGLQLTVSVSLKKGAHAKIRPQRPVVIVGEVRYCQRAGQLFNVGIQIEEVLISPNRHLDDGELALYFQGKGLTMPELFYVRLHLADCEACRRRLRENEAILNDAPAQRV